MFRLSLFVTLFLVITSKTFSQTRPGPLSEGERQMYEALGAVYLAAYNDTAEKEHFTMAPLSDKMLGTKRDQKGRGIYKEMVLGKNMRETVAELLGVSTAQVVLPSGMGDSYISYCYKSAVKTKDADLLESIQKELGLKYTTKDSLQEMITLEVTDTSLLYADLPLADEKTSKMTISGKDNILSSMNNNLAPIVKVLQARFKCLVVVKDADHYKKKVNMTIKTGSLIQLHESMLSYGIKATKGEEMQKVYYFSAISK